MFPSSFLAAGLLSIAIHFDGSLKYATHDGRGLPRASCAASIKIDDQACVLGGQLLDSSYFTTSSQVEYEGLLLGLEGLLSYWQGNMRDDRGFLASRAMFANDRNVHIYGDCKSVLDQMTGRSRPRKLKAYHNRAVGLLRDLHLTHPSAKFQFHHVPRSHNKVCDRLSALVLAMKETEDYQNLLSDFKSLFDYSSAFNLKTRIARFLEKHLEGIPSSQLWSFFWGLARLAKAKNDWQTLLMIGQWWDQALVEWRQDQGKTGLEVQEFERLHFDTIGVQLMALEVLGLYNEADSLTRKNLYLLGGNRNLYDVNRLLLESNISFGGLESEFSAYGNKQWPNKVIDWYNFASQSHSWRSQRKQWCLV